MARPRIFLSSTYYDLKYVRSSLETFIDGIGYEAILSEKGDVAYSHDVPLDESCYREVQNCDILVLVIGGRYGSLASGGEGASEHSASITKTEHKAAIDADIPVYVLIERAVYAEYQTYMKNKGAAVSYAHVDSPRVFEFIESILSQIRNNPVQPFDRAADIEEWLRGQWAGLFRELLRKKTNQRQLSSLASQVDVLAEVNKTLKRYLEEVMEKVAPSDAKRIINAETKRLDDVQRQGLQNSNVVQFLLRQLEASSFDDILDMLQLGDQQSFAAAVRGRARTGDGERFDRLMDNPAFREDVNIARATLGLTPWWSAQPEDGASRDDGSRRSKKT